MAGKKQFFKIVFMFFLILSREVMCLKMIDVIVPTYKIRGENAVLECRFDLENDFLYSVKWYKGGEEFYRFMPRQLPAQHSYNLKGIKVDLYQSNEMKVTLKNVILKSSGEYRCEVSAEAPSFSTVSETRSMEVVYLAQDGPYISGKESGQKQGVLNLNCTSGKTYPSSILNWYINDEKVTNSMKLINYEPETYQHGLLRTVSGLKLFIDTEPFYYGVLTIKCVAKVSLKPWNTDQDTSGDRVALLLNNREAVIILKNDGLSMFLTSKKTTVMIIIFHAIVALTIY